MSLKKTPSLWAREDFQHVWQLKTYTLNTGADTKEEDGQRHACFYREACSQCPHAKREPPAASGGQTFLCLDRDLSRQQHAKIEP